MQKRELKRLALHRETILTLQHQDRRYAALQAVTGISITIQGALLAQTRCPCDSTVEVC